MKLNYKGIAIGVVLVLAFVAVYQKGINDGQTGNVMTLVPNAEAKKAESQPKLSPVKARARDVYYPNSENLAPDEMRVVACGTGMPATRAAQAAACFLVELGNGDKFIFDIGTGSAERISSLQIPYDYLDKIFIGHLHADHFGSLGEMFIGGALMGRQKPLRVWGPSGPTPELGTAYAVQKMKEMYRWEPPGGDSDREQFSKDARVPVEGLSYSDFIIEGRWGEVDEVLRGVYQEASKTLGQEFPYTGDEKRKKK